MADYDRDDNDGGSGGFRMGLLTGTVLGAGLGMLLAPKAGAEIRGALGEQARTWGNTASEQYRRASDNAGTWAERGREMVDKAREAVVRGSEEARGYATGTTGTTGSGYNGGTAGSNSGSSFGNGPAAGPGNDFGRS